MSEISSGISGFNLWHSPWIRVLEREGRVAELSISECLRRAEELHVLCDPSPLVVGGTHRLLVAILQSIFNPCEPGDLVALLNAKHFPHDQLNIFEAVYAERFDLFHSTYPFLQAGDIPLDDSVTTTEKSKIRKTTSNEGLPKTGSGIDAVARLLPERPSGNNRTHFWHLREDRYALCPSCCARALVIMPAFARNEGRGYTYGVNSGPPLYLLPVGNDLFESLALSLLTEGYLHHADKARRDMTPWDRFEVLAKHETDHVGYIEALTFPARRIRLFPRQEPGECALCGAWSDVTVAQVYYYYGHRWKKETSLWWQDPFVAYTPPDKKSKKQQPSGITLKPGRAIWRDYHTLLRLHNDSGPQHEQLGALWLQQLRDALIGDEGHYPVTELIRVRCVGMRVSSDAKIFEWMDEALEVPVGLLRDEGSLYTVAEMMECVNDCAKMLRDVFNRNFIAKRGRTAKMDEKDREKARRCRTTRERMLATYWERLAAPFRDSVRKSGDREERRHIKRDWSKHVSKLTRVVFNETVEQLGERGELLRQTAEARNDLGKELNKYERA